MIHRDKFSNVYMCFMCVWYPKIWFLEDKNFNFRKNIIYIQWKEKQDDTYKLKNLIDRRAKWNITNILHDLIVIKLLWDRFEIPPVCLIYL